MRTATVAYRLRGSSERSCHVIETGRARFVVETLLVNRLVEWISLDDGTQVCSACGERKDRSTFYRHPGAKTGHHYECRPCFDERRARNRARTGR